MADSSAFRAQLASIMEVMANTAVAEICQLVDDGYAVLRLEMTRSYKENEALRRKVKSLELNSSGIRGSKRSGLRNVSGLAVAAQGSCSFPKGREESYMPAVESVFGPQMDVMFDRNQQSTHCEEPPVVSRDQKERTDVLNVKEERLEDSGTSVPPEDKIRAERSPDWRAASREKRPIQETQNKAANHMEELTEQHRTRRAVWEVSGLDSGLKAEPGDNGVNEDDEHFRHENDPEEPYHLDSEYFTSVRSSRRGALISPEVRQTEAEDSAESYVPLTDPENLAVELVEVTPALNGCDSSNTYFITSEGRFAHYKDIPRKSGYVCKYCGKHFARRNVLVKHHRVHTGEKPFSCLLCGRRFSDSSNLRKHQSVHTGEKRFRCAQCGKGFSDSSSRKRHQTVHTGKKPFGCSECGKRFTRPCHLKRHCQQFHSWETPFSEHAV